MNRFRRQILLLAAVVLIGGGSFAISVHLFSEKRTSAQQVLFDEQGRPITIVSLGGSMASPNTVTVKLGESVQFNATDNSVHNLSLGEGGSKHEHTGPYSSGDFGNDEAWRVSFKKPGTYFFHDHYNPTTNILVVAYEDTLQDDAGDNAQD